MEEAKDCGCRALSYIDGRPQLMTPHAVDCRYPTLLAENAELKRQAEDNYGKAYEILCAADESIGLQSSTVGAASAMARKYKKLAQERDALAGELAKYKAFVREKCGVFENETLWYNDQCFACMEEKAFGNLQHKPDCLYIQALEEKRS